MVQRPLFDRINLINFLSCGGEGLERVKKVFLTLLIVFFQGVFLASQSSHESSVSSMGKVKKTGTTFFGFAKKSKNRIMSSIILPNKITMIRYSNGDVIYLDEKQKLNKMDLF